MYYSKEVPQSGEPSVFAVKETAYSTLTMEAAAPPKRLNKSTKIYGVRI